MQDAIQRLKHDSASAQRLGKCMAPHARERFAGFVDMVVPIPLSNRKLKQRGFNQSAILAREVSRALGVPFVSNCLFRQRSGPTQASLGAEARRASLRGAFKAKRSLDHNRILIIDDVVTTGATFAEARHILLGAGAEHVASFALAATVSESSFLPSTERFSGTEFDETINEKP